MSDKYATRAYADASASAANEGTQLYLRRDFALNPSMPASALGTAINAAIQSAISAGKALNLGSEAWRVDVPVLIDGPLTGLVSDGVVPMWGSQTAAQAFGIADVFDTLAQPLMPPFLDGGQIIQESAGANVLTIPVSGQAVNLRNIGLRFHDAIKFVNTGHVIYAIPAQTWSTGLDNGLLGARWDNVQAYGHDGNHYAFVVTNPLLDTFIHCHSFGGGGWLVANDSSAGGRNYGNTVHTHSYSVVCATGSAHAYALRSPNLNSGGAANGKLQYMTFYHPQAWVRDINGFTAPTSAQRTVDIDDIVDFVVLDNMAMESSFLGALNPDGTRIGGPRFPVHNVAFTGVLFATPGMLDGLLIQRSSSRTYSNPATPRYEVLSDEQFLYLQRYVQGFRSITVGLTAANEGVYLTGHLGSRSGLNSTAAAGAQAGVGAPAPVATGARNMRGSVTFGTGTSPAAGEMVVVTHGQAEEFNNPLPVISPLNDASYDLGLYAVAIDKTAFRVRARNAPAASQANTVYAFSYHCIA